MSDPLTREQFKTAVADAVTGILNVYREVDAMIQELDAALRSGEPRFVPLLNLRKPLVPGANSRNPDARYLRNYRAWLFAPPNDVDEEEEDDEDDDGDDDEPNGKKKTPLVIREGTSLIVVRATIFDRTSSGFEPHLVVGTLARCRAEPAVAAGIELKVSRGKLRRVLRAIDDHKAGSKPVKTDVPVTVGSQKSKHALVFDLPEPLTRHALFEITPDVVQRIASSIRGQPGPLRG